jgi:hypothetical protein
MISLFHINSVKTGWSTLEDRRSSCYAEEKKKGRVFTSVIEIVSDFPLSNDYVAT